MLVYNVPGWHRTIFEDENKNKEFQDFLQKSNYKKFDQFANEVFSRIYSDDGVEQKEEIPYYHNWAKECHETLSSLPEYKALKQNCANDSFLSMIATQQLAIDIHKLLPQKNVNDELEEYENMLEQLNEEKSLTPETEEKIKSKIEELKNETQPVNQQEMRIQARKSIDEINDKIQDIKTFASTCGTEPADLEFQKIALSAFNKKEIYKILKMAGSLSNLYTTIKKKKTQYSHTEVSDITIGQSLSRAIASELVNEDLFIYKFITKQLLIHNLKSNESMSRGNVILCIDASGSMYGHKEDTAKAIAIAIHGIMKKEKRQMVACLFNTSVQKELKSEKDIIPFLSIRSDGGTNVSSALKWSDDINMDNADIILLTDGCVEDDIYIPKRNVFTILIEPSEIPQKLNYISSNIITSDGTIPSKDILTFIAK